MAGPVPGTAALLLTGAVCVSVPAAALMPGEFTVGAASGGIRLAEDSEGVSPFPIAPLPGDGTGTAPSSVGGDPAGVGPFPIPGVDRSPGPSQTPARPPSELTGAERPGPAAAGRDADARGARAPTEREVGVPPFPYDPEARGGAARQCVRDCAATRSDCAQAGKPVRQCEGDFVLCARDCVLAPGLSNF